MMQRLISTITALRLFLSQVKIFDPENAYKDKRVAVIGAADTAFEEQNGEFIDSFDFVVRVNRAMHSWDPEKQKFIGKKTNIHFHSFYENEYSGGGPIDFKLFNKFDLQYLVHPTNSLKGIRVHLNFYKRHPERKQTYLLSKSMYKRIAGDFKNAVPTTGYFALMSALNAPCRELFINGFTFFKTPYSPDYRDHLRDLKVNEEHIKKQGLHDPDLELALFKKRLETSPCKKVILDKGLTSILQYQDS